MLWTLLRYVGPSEKVQVNTLEVSTIKELDISSSNWDKMCGALKTKTRKELLKFCNMVAFSTLLYGKKILYN